MSAYLSSTAPDEEGTGLVAKLRRGVRHQGDGYAQPMPPWDIGAADDLMDQAATLIESQSATIRGLEGERDAAIVRAAKQEDRAEIEEKLRLRWFKAWRIIIDGIIGHRPLCGDCADEHGSCPRKNGLPCDPSAEVVERYRMLEGRATSAERALAPFAEIGALLTDEDGWSDETMLELEADPHYGRFATIKAGHFRRARKALGESHG